MKFFSLKYNLYHSLIALILSLLHIFIVVTLEPLNQAQGVFGNIFYIHVPIAWTAFILYFLVMIIIILFLVKKSKIWDFRAYALAEVGTIFMALVLITGLAPRGYYYGTQINNQLSIIHYIFATIGNME